MSQPGFQLNRDSSSWPALPLEDWRDTRDTLQLYTQIVGKIRMTLSPELNHWWHVTLYVNARGLGTSPIPYPGGIFEIDFDFLKHQLDIRTSEGERKLLPLTPQPVALFYDRVMAALRTLGIPVEISTRPQELSDAIPFEQDYRHASYDREYVYRFWRILISSARVMEEFRARFLGKSSPVHFFWGSFDLACTRFSGRLAEPPRKGVITAPAYSHEVISAGFWPGGGAVNGPAFYAYAAPSPQGLEEETIEPAEAHWNKDLGEFILMYDDVRRSETPESKLMSFFQSTYDRAARLGKWDGSLQRVASARHA